MEVGWRDGGGMEAGWRGDGRGMEAGWRGDGGGMEEGWRGDGGAIKVNTAVLTLIRK